MTDVQKLVQQAIDDRVGSGAEVGVQVAVYQVYGNVATWGLGYALGRLGARPGTDREVIAMGGAGGTFGYADLATGTAFALTKNLQTMNFDTAERVIGIVGDAS
jgi:hypothetical protein